MMTRSIRILAALVFSFLLVSTTYAQFPGLRGGRRGAELDIDAMRKKALERQKKQAVPKAKTPPRARGPALGNPGSRDRYGRMDLAGRPAPGYPSARGQLGVEKQAQAKPAPKAVRPRPVPKVPSRRPPAP